MIPKLVYNNNRGNMFGFSMGFRMVSSVSCQVRSWLTYYKRSVKIFPPKICWSPGVSKEIFKSNAWRVFIAGDINKAYVLLQLSLFLFNIFLCLFFNYRTYAVENLQSVVSLLIDTVIDEMM